MYVCAAKRQDNKETGALSEEEENTGKPWRGESLVHAQWLISLNHAGTDA